MKTTSRKRLLVSSVAMLLVAMLALGTATFAWFTVDTTTKARGITVQTSKKSTIQVSSVDKAWTTDLDYAFNDTLVPASSYDGVNWYTAQATNANSYAATEGEKVTNVATAANGKVFYNMLNVKNAGSEALTNVHIKATLNEVPVTNGKNYLRVALVESTAKADGDRSSATVKDATTFRSNIWGTTDTTTKPVDHVGASTSATSGAIVEGASAVSTKGTSIDVEVGALATGAAKYYMLIVWFEGQDADCYDLYAGNSISNLTFTITEDATT